MNNELKQIKKIYGEEMMHLARRFPTLLEKEGTFLEILKEHLAPTHTLASEVVKYDLFKEFKDWIYSYSNADNIELSSTDKNPFELMNLAGYDLFECKTEKDIQSFKKYYKDSELICTIYNGHRLDRCYVFFAVKKNVDEIKREDFKRPRREDLYGTSVISIQFDKGNYNVVSIKNRYNHSVKNPDSTFSNNLENIIPGLTKSFEKYLNFDIIQNETYADEFLLLNLQYVKGDDSKYYRYNTIVDTTCYCENNIIIKDGKVITTYSENKERYIVMDKYILDLENKTISLLDNEQDSFIDSIDEIGKIKKIEVLKNKGNRDIFIYYEDDKKIKITINRNNAIVGYENKYVTHINENFLDYNQVLTDISLPNVETINSSFLFFNRDMKTINLPNVKIIGNNFLAYNQVIDSVYTPNVKIIGSNFLRGNKMLKEVFMPYVTDIGEDFLSSNEILEDVHMTSVKKIDDSFLDSARNIKKIVMPSVKEIGNDFLISANNVKELIIPDVEKIGSNFLRRNRDLKKVFLPSVKEVGYNFLASSKELNEIYMPSVKKIGTNFLLFNRELERVFMPYVIRIGDNFLCNNVKIKMDNIYMPCVQDIGLDFLLYNRDFVGVTADDIRKNNYIDNAKDRRI